MDEAWVCVAALAWAEEASAVVSVVASEEDSEVEVTGWVADSGWEWVEEVEEWVREVDATSPTTFTQTTMDPTEVLRTAMEWHEPSPRTPNQQIIVRNVSPLCVRMGRKLICFQLPWSTSNEDLVELFETVGSVVLAEILYDGTRSKGEGVVQFTETAEGSDCGRKVHGIHVWWPTAWYAQPPLRLSHR